MGNFNRKVRIIAVLAFVAFLISFGLLNYHYSFDPYTWLKPAEEGVLSRHLWLERRDIYAYSVLVSFGAFFIAAAYLLVSWIIKRRNRVNLK
jgi:hypothetical protein